MSITPDNIESADTNQVLLGAVDNAEKAMLPEPMGIVERVRLFLRKAGGAPLSDEPTDGPPTQKMNRRSFFKANAAGALAVAFGAQALAACGRDEIDGFFEKSEDLAGKFGDFVGKQVEALTTNLQMLWGGTLNTFDLREDPINLKQLKDAAASLDSQDPDDLDVSDRVLGFLYKEVVQPAFYEDEYTNKMLQLPKGNLQELFTEWYMIMKCLRYLTQERNANKLKAKFAREKADRAYNSPSSDKAEKQLDIAREKLANARESGDKSTLYYFEKAVQQAERDLQVANASQRSAVEGANEKADKAEEKVDQLRNIVSGLLAGELHARNDFGDAISRAN